MKSFIYYIGLAILLLSCEDVIELEVPNSETKLVVEGFITDHPGTQTIKLTESQAFFENTEAPPFSGATVTLTDDQGRNEILAENPVGSGLYTTDMAGEHGRLYMLNIDLPDGRTYRSEAELLISTPTLDSLYSRFVGEDEDGEAEYSIFFDSTDPPNETNFYRWKLTVNDSLRDDPIDLFFADDQFVSGPIRETELTFIPVRLGDSILVEMQSISEGHYIFLNELLQQTLSFGPFATPPASIKSNLINVDNPEDRALGYFGAIGVDRLKIVVE